jgi:hypothetical protein
MAAALDGAIAAAFPNQLTQFQIYARLHPKAASNLPQDLRARTSQANSNL